MGEGEQIESLWVVAGGFVWGVFVGLVRLGAHVLVGLAAARFLGWF